MCHRTHYIAATFQFKGNVNYPLTIHYLEFRTILQRKCGIPQAKKINCHFTYSPHFMCMFQRSKCHFFPSGSWWLLGELIRWGWLVEILIQFYDQWDTTKQPKMIKYNEKKINHSHSTIIAPCPIGLALWTGVGPTDSFCWSITTYNFFISYQTDNKKSPTLLY